VLRSNSHFFSKNTCERELVAAGFVLKQANQRDSLESIEFAFDDQWIRLISNSSLNVSDPLNTLMGEPGLWKLISYKNRKPWKVFEFPSVILTENNSDFETVVEEAKSPLSATLRWARDTLNGERFNSWSSPPKPDMLDLISPDSLTVQCGRYARQGELICNPKRLALRFPLIFHVPDDLPDSSAYWLRNLLIDAQNRWKLVRIGFRDKSSATTVQAEVDLTGAPHSVLAGLMTVALSSLHAVATWVIPSAEFLAEQTADLWALNVHTGINAEGYITTKGGE
jgi:hypothetical protein